MSKSIDRRRRAAEFAIVASLLAGMMLGLVGFPALREAGTRVDAWGVTVAVVALAAWIGMLACLEGALHACRSALSRRRVGSASNDVTGSGDSS